MKTKLWVGGILLLFALYLYASFASSVALIRAPEPLAKGIGIAALLIPLLGVWILIREILFGSRSQRMAGILESEGLLPEDDLPRTPSGRIVKAAADEDFVQYQQEATEHPDSWRSMHRLALAYDASGDRRRARETMRRAIGLFRASADARATTGS